MLPPAAGMMPMTSPVAQPRISDQRTWKISDGLGQMFQLSALLPEMFDLASPSLSSSPWAKANRPMMAGRMPNPDSSEMMPNV